MHQVMLLHLVAVDMILARTEDAARFDKAGPHVQALLDSSEPRYQAFGHLFAGSIDLDRSGIAREMAGGEDGPAGRQARPKLRSSALEPPQARRRRPARYRRGPGQVRRRAGARPGAEPRPPVPPERACGSAAWSRSISSGPPGRSSRPVIPRRPSRSCSRCSARSSRGACRARWRGRSTCSSGELYQARRSPDDLKKAVEEFDKALAAGQAVTPTAVMRLAQIDVQLGQYDRALARLERRAVAGQGGRNGRAARRS